MNAWINWRRLHALCRKETLEIVRDPSSVLIAFVLPVVLLFIFGFGISLDTSRIRLGIVMEDSGVLANRFAEALRDHLILMRLSNTHVNPCRKNWMPDNCVVL